MLKFIEKLQKPRMSSQISIFLYPILGAEMPDIGKFLKASFVV